MLFWDHNTSNLRNWDDEDFWDSGIDLRTSFFMLGLVPDLDRSEKMLFWDHNTNNLRDWSHNMIFGTMELVPEPHFLLLGLVPDLDWSEKMLFWDHNSNNLRDA